VKAGGRQSHLPSRYFLLGLFFCPENGEHVPPKRRLTFKTLYGGISQRIELFITTAVRTSNPAEL
jgi:hypothetical protein